MIIRSVVLSIALGSILAACVGAFGPPAPSDPPRPVVTEADAFARVLAHEPRFVGITRRDPDRIGQASWYEVEPASGVGAFVVTIRIGWGDCPAGCIDEHRWLYAIGPDGSVSLQSETGPVVPPDAWPAAGAGAGATGLRIVAVAGPICPVERDPPDPACAPRPVAGAIISIQDAQGREVASAVLDEAGTAAVAVAAGGYTIVAAPVEGLMGTPGPVEAAVVAGSVTEVALDYDTGIR